MKNRAPRFLLALMLSGAGAAAQETAPAPTPAPAQTTDASAVVLTAKPRAGSEPVAPPDEASRSVSSKVAAALSLGAPKYSPPTPTPTEAAEPQDMRDYDKPKNEIHRLPKFVVREARPPIFRNRDLYTKDGMLDLTMKSHAGLNFGNIFGLNANPKPGSPAYQMMVDDQRKESMDDLLDEAHAMSLGGDSAQARYILQQSDSTYMRGGGTWDWSGTGRVGGLTGADK